MMRLIAAAVLAVLLAGCGKGTGPMGGKPVSHWAEALRDPDATVRKKAVFKLGNIGSAEAWPAVLGALKDVDPHVRAEAVQAVLKFGPQATDAMRALTELEKNDEDSQVRSLAGQALDKLRRDQVATKR